MALISARLPDDEAEELERVADMLGEDKSSVIRKALSEGLRDLRVRRAIERYQTGEIGQAGRPHRGREPR